MNTAANIAPLLPFVPPAGSDRLVKLRDAEIEISRLFDAASRPSRNTVIGWIEEGTLLGKQIGGGRNYYVWRSSLDKFIQGLSPNLSLAA